MRRFRFDSMSLADTDRLGQALGQVAVPGLVVGLRGALGTGKTAFVRAVAQGLQIADRRWVTSPTFVLIQEYPARLPVFHFDTYRLSDPSQFADLGVEEYFEGEGVCLVEWADRVESLLPRERLDVLFSTTSDRGRMIDCGCVGRRFAALFEQWRDLVGATGG